MNSFRNRVEIKHTNFPRRISPRYREVPISISENPIFRFHSIYMCFSIFSLTFFKKHRVFAILTLTPSGGYLQQIASCTFSGPRIPDIPASADRSEGIFYIFQASGGQKSYLKMILSLVASFSQSISPFELLPTPFRPDFIFYKLHFFRFGPHFSNTNQFFDFMQIANRKQLLLGNKFIK